ncbi:MAG: hypothetical protein ACJAYF_001135 [Arenicella sp.]|jgi:hypothetical protein
MTIIMSKHTSIFKIFVSLLIASSAIFLAQLAQANGERAPYGNNLLDNPNAEAGNMTGWTILEDGGNGWRAVTNANTSLNGFQTSHRWAKREQIVNLMDMGFSAAILDKAPPILISEAFGKRFCADQYFLDIELLGANQQVLKTWSSGVREHENTVCEWRAYQEFLEQKLSNYGAGVRYIRWRDGGKDTEGWGGHYGAQLENAYLGILPPNLLNNPGELTSWNVTENWADGFSVTGPPEARQFKTSFAWTSRQQTIDLVAQGYSAATLDESPPMMVSGTYGAFFNCSDNYYLKAELLDANQQVIKSWDSGERQHTGACDPNNPSSNETITAFLDYGPGVRFIRWEDGGKDTEYWSGHYGAVLQDPYVGLLLVPEVHNPNHGRRLSGSFLSDVFVGGATGAILGGLGCTFLTAGAGGPVCFAIAASAYTTATVVGASAVVGAGIGMAHYATTEAHSTDDPSTTIHQYTQNGPLVEKHPLASFYAKHTVKNNLPGETGYNSGYENLTDPFPIQPPTLSSASVAWLTGFKEGTCLTGALDTIDNIIYLYPVAATTASDSTFQCKTPQSIATNLPNYNAINHSPSQTNYTAFQGPSHAQILIRQSPHYGNSVDGWNDDMGEHGIGFFLQVLDDDKFIIDYNSRSLHRWKFIYDSKKAPACSVDPRCFPPEEWTKLIGDALKSNL